MVKIEKVVVNIGVGEGGERLRRAEKVLKLLTNQKPLRTLSKTTNKEWGIRKRSPIGCKATLRGEAAEKFLKEALWERNNKLPEYSFTKDGTFSFGIPDYTAFRGIKYDPGIGIFGMDVCVVLGKPGYRIKYRKKEKHGIPPKQRVNKNEAIEFLRKRFGVEIV